MRVIWLFLQIGGSCLWVSLSFGVHIRAPDVWNLLYGGCSGGLALKAYLLQLQVYTTDVHRHVHSEEGSDYKNHSATAGQITASSNETTLNSGYCREYTKTGLHPGLELV